MGCVAIVRNRAAEPRCLRVEQLESVQHGLMERATRPGISVSMPDFVQAIRYLVSTPKYGLKGPSSRHNDRVVPGGPQSSRPSPSYAQVLPTTPTAFLAYCDANGLQLAQDVTADFLRPYFLMLAESHLAVGNSKRCSRSVHEQDNL